jgi:hypothetical protein
VIAAKKSTCEPVPNNLVTANNPINLRYRDVIAAKKGTCEPVSNNLVTANKMSRQDWVLFLPWATFTRP